MSPRGTATGICEMEWYKNMPPVDLSSRHEVLIEDQDGLLTPMDEPYFRATELDEGVWQILSDGDYSYLVAGDREALLIDTGYGAGNIREFCRTLTDRPLSKVANTHFHFDHTANNYLFDAAFMSAESVELRSIPEASFGGIDFPRDYPVEVIDEGYVFDLGGVRLETYKFSDHSPGSLAFLDRRHRLFFSGDEMVAENYRVKYSLDHSIAMVEKFRELIPYYDRLCAGPGIFPASLVEEYAAALEFLRADPEAGRRPLPVFPPTPVPDGQHRAVYPRRFARSCDLWRRPDPDFDKKRELVFRGRRIEYWTNKL